MTGRAGADYTDLISPLVDLYQAESALAVHARGAGPTLAAIESELYCLRRAGEGFDGRSSLVGEMVVRVRELEATRAMLEESEKVDPRWNFLVRLIINFGLVHDVDPGNLSLGSKPSNGSANALMDFLISAFAMAGIGRHPDTIWKDANRFRRLWPHAVKGRDTMRSGKARP